MMLKFFKKKISAMHDIKIIYSTPHTIIFNMGKGFNNIEVTFNCEEMSKENKAEIFSKSIKCSNDNRIIFSEEERRQIIEAIVEWNSHINTLVFV